MLLRPVRAPDVIAEELDDDVCLYRAETDEVLVLNRTAADVWRLADGKRSVEAIVTELSHTYVMDEAELSGDVEQVLDDLARRGYLVDEL